MKRIVSVGIALAAAGACGHGSKPSSGSGSGSGSGSSTAANDGGSATPPPPPPAGDPTPALVAAAFGGKVPAFPLLSGDGATAAYAVTPFVGMTDVSTYAVALVQWGAPQLNPIVDATVAKMLLDAESGEPAPAPDPAVLAERAGAVTKRLADEKFTPFDHPQVALQIGDNTVGPYKLKAERSAAGDLALSLADAAGNPRMTETTKPRPMAHVADSDCVATPLPRAAWFDAARHRVLVEIDWTAGADVCEAPDPDYKLWVVP